MMHTSMTTGFAFLTSNHSNLFRISSFGFSMLLFVAEVGQLAGGDFLFPFVEEWPGDGAGAEVGHVLILRQAVDRLLQDAVVTAKDRPVARQQELGVVLDDALQRLQVIRNVRSMMCVDDANAAVLVNVVAAKKEITHLEAELSGGVPRR